MDETNVLLTPLPKYSLDPAAMKECVGNGEAIGAPTLMEQQYLTREGVEEKTHKVSALIPTNQVR
eukprot:2659434-Amphidinium_carterae.1